MRLSLVDRDDPVLRQVARPVADAGSQRVRELAEALDALRIEAGGMGLAAPQAGISERIIIVEVPDDEWVGFPEVPSFPPTVLINPEVVWESGEFVKLPEACLSLPGLMGNVVRPSSITVQALDLDGSRVTIHADRWLARVLQHEIDHLDGVLYVDRVEDAHELWYVERVDVDDPVWNRNPQVLQLREELRRRQPAEPRLS
jgi:peptide deformylase